MARTPESSVKDHLDQRIRALGGEVRFLKWIGRNHAPDCFVMLPQIPVTLVETKAPGKVPRPGQLREHARLRKYGVRVLICPTKEDIDREFPAP